MNQPNVLPRSPLNDVRERMTAAARIAGRDPGEITLVAISKTHPPAAILPLIAGGAARVRGKSGFRGAG